LESEENQGAVALIVFTSLKDLKLESLRPCQPLIEAMREEIWTCPVLV